MLLGLQATMRLIHFDSGYGPGGPGGKGSGDVLPRPPRPSQRTVPDIRKGEA